MIAGKLYLWISAAALGGGVVGGLTVHYASGSRSTAKGAGLSASAEPKASGDLGGRLENLERSVASLERERHLRSLVSAQDDGDPAAAADAGPRRAVVDDPVFDTAVRDVIEQVETERTSERQLKGAERRRQNAERIGNDLAQELGLSDAQKAKVLEVVQSYYDQLRAIRDGDGGAPLSRSETREKMRDLRDKNEERLGQILDATQLEKYKQLDDEKRIGFGGGRRAGRGGE